jgi:ABC-type multidrug transport system fused ATPase/permease subunit
MNSGDVMSRIDGDADQFIHAVQRNLFHFVNSIFLCSGIIYMVARINWTIAVILIIAAALPIVITRQCGKLTQKYAKESREITGTFTGRLFEILKGIREIRLACADWWANAQVLNPLKKLIALGNRTRRVDFCVGKGIYLVNLSISLVIYGYSAHLIMQDGLTVGVFLAVIEYIALLHKKFNWMLRIYLDWFARKISIDRVNAILDTESETDAGADIAAIKTVEFRDVCFAYEENVPVLENVSFLIRKGERVAVAGASGVGKTTIIGLLMGFYTPTSGEILVNGTPMSGIRPSALRRCVGMVSQDVLLFDETVRYNLCLGGDYSDKQLLEALKQAELLDTVKNLPDGLDSKISAAGDLSGGQKQRLMLARLMLKKTDFIILDEATASLDVETEAQITGRLRGFSEDTTMLVVSHRLAAVRGCGRIIVLRNKTVDADGTHESLLRHSAAYQAMFGGATD